MPYVGSVPQSGCTFTEPTQLVMIVLELGSTGAEEMSVFHKLLLAKGTNPLRLAVWPVDITLQARLLPPVPPLFPPELPVPPFPPVLFDEVETPEQAVSQTICVNRIESNRGSFQPDPEPRITRMIVRDELPDGKRPFGHVPILGWVSDSAERIVIARVSCRSKCCADSREILRSA